MTATFTNESTTQQIGSANLFWPAGFSASVQPQSPGSVSQNCTDNGVAVGACVQLRNLELAPGGGSVTVTMTVTTPPCEPGQFGWSAEVKQDNNFNGTPGNDFTFDPSVTPPSTTLDGACSLEFSEEPADAQTGQAISGAAYTPEPTGPAVAVQVLDNKGNPLTTSTIPVATSIGTNAFGATLGGTPTQQAAAGTGIATFPDLNLNLPGVGYTLVATSGQLGRAQSSPPGFEIQDETAACGSSSCTTTESPSGVNSSTLVANAGGAGELVESAFSGSYGQQTLALCGSSYASADPYVYESGFSGTGRSEVDTTAFAPTTKLSGSPQQVLKAQQICFGDATPFPTASGSPDGTVTLPNGQTLYVGLLPTCTGNTTTPCHNRQQDTTVPDKHSRTGYDIVLVDDVPAAWADDPYRM
jgi:hypothetical protein